MAHQPHDALFKGIFEHPRAAAALLRSHLPYRLRIRLDLEDLRPVRGSFVDSRLGQRHADLVFVARLASTQALVFLLFEHLSTSQVLAPVRIWVYGAHIVDGWMSTHRKAHCVPPVLALVVHHGSTQQLPRQNLRNCFCGQHADRAAMAPWLPSWRIHVVDLPRLPDEALGDDPKVALTLRLLKYGRDPDVLDRVRTWADLVRQVRHQPDGLHATELVVSYLLGTGGGRIIDAVSAALAPALGRTEARHMTMSLADRLREEGRREGILEGRREGILEGRREGILEGRREASRSLLVDLAQRRFGPLPDAIRHRIDQASEDTLHRWARRLLDASSLAEVFDDA